MLKLLLFLIFLCVKLSESNISVKINGWDDNKITIEIEKKQYDIPKGPTDSKEKIKQLVTKFVDAHIAEIVNKPSSAKPTAKTTTTTSTTTKIPTARSTAIPTYKKATKFPTQDLAALKKMENEKKLELEYDRTYKQFTNSVNSYCKNFNKVYTKQIHSLFQQLYNVKFKMLKNLSFTRLQISWETRRWSKRITRIVRRTIKEARMRNQSRPPIRFPSGPVSSWKKNPMLKRPPIIRPNFPIFRGPQFPVFNKPHIHIVPRPHPKFTACKSKRGCNHHHWYDSHHSHHGIQRYKCGKMGCRRGNNEHHGKHGHHGNKKHRDHHGHHGNKEHNDRR